MSWTTTLMWHKPKPSVRRIGAARIAVASAVSAASLCVGSKMTALQSRNARRSGAGAAIRAPLRRPPAPAPSVPHWQAP